MMLIRLNKLGRLGQLVRISRLTNILVLVLSILVLIVSERPTTSEQYSASSCFQECSMYEQVQSPPS